MSLPFRYDEPFVLLDFEEKWQLFRRPSSIVEVRDPAQVVPALESLRRKNAAGFIGYEGGYSLEPKVSHLARASAPEDPPLLWFGIFDDPETAPELPDASGAWLSAPRPLIAADEYSERLRTLDEHLLDGDIYQANFTFPAEVRFEGHPLAVYAQLRSRAKAGWGAVVFTGEHWIISCSPELFFKLKDGKVTTRPMKGTAPPDSDPEALRSDPKQRAENLMIVDLLRNDISKVAEPGTVDVPRLLEVERYPTVLQMTSTVVAELQPRLGPVDVIQAMFPCGSVTGVPKISAMEIIHREEADARGVYTGSIGMMDAKGAAAFNVAIRTLTIRAGSDRATLGLGSGIVADSIAESEWLECLQKGKFIPSETAFELIETMRAEGGAVSELPLHLDRLQRSAAQFDFAFDRARIERSLSEAALASGSGRLRLTLSSVGDLTIQAQPLTDFPDQLRAMLLPLPVDRHDFRLRHKTTDRAFYDDAREQSGCDEVVFLDPDGFVTEGSFTNVFIERDGHLVTPPVGRGLLSGVLRRKLLDSGDAIEGDLTAEDLADGFFLGNSLRGLMPAKLGQFASRRKFAISS